MHTIRCLGVNLDIAIIPGFPEGCTPFEAQGAGAPATTVWGTRRDTGLLVSTSGHLRVTQITQGASNHTYNLPAGTHLILFGRDGTSLTFEAAVGVFFSCANMSVDFARARSAE